MSYSDAWHICCLFEDFFLKIPPNSRPSKFYGASYVGAAAKGEFQPKTSIKYTHTAEKLLKTVLTESRMAERE